MLYLQNITDAQTLMIPRNGESISGGMSLVLRNTTDLQECAFSVDDLDDSDLYVKVSVELPDDLADGEYQYQLVQGLNLVSNGLLVIESFNDNTQYDQSITYHQYGE